MFSFKAILAASFMLATTLEALPSSRLPSDQQSKLRVGDLHSTAIQRRQDRYVGNAIDSEPSVNHLRRRTPNPPAIPHVMKPKNPPAGHPDHKADETEAKRHAHVLHGHIDLHEHPHITQEHTAHAVKETYHHVMKPENRFENHAGSPNRLVAGYHGGGLTDKIHLSTIPSHGPGGEGHEHTLKNKLNDRVHMAKHAPMLYHAMEGISNAKKEGHPSIHLSTYPHAEAGAIYKFEKNIHKLHPDKSPEERRVMALQHFRPENLKTYGMRDGKEGEHEPCKYQCAFIMNDIKWQQKQLSS